MMHMCEFCEAMPYKFCVKWVVDIKCDKTWLGKGENMFSQVFFTKFTVSIDCTFQNDENHKNKMCNRLHNYYNRLFPQNYQLYPLFLSKIMFSKVPKSYYESYNLCYDVYALD